MIRCHRFRSCAVCGLCDRCCLGHALAPVIQALNGAQAQGGKTVHVPWKAGAASCPMRFNDEGAPLGRRAARA